MKARNSPEESGEQRTGRSRDATRETGLTTRAHWAATSTESTPAWRVASMQRVLSEDTILCQTGTTSMHGQRSSNCLCTVSKVILAGIAGADFAKSDLLDRNIWYQVGYLVPLILMLAAVDYMIQILILSS